MAYVPTELKKVKGRKFSKSSRIGSSDSTKKTNPWNSLTIMWATIAAAAVLAFLTVLFSAFQFSYTAFTDYRKSLDEFNSKRYDNLEIRLYELEKSATNASLPTTTPNPVTKD